MNYKLNNNQIITLRYFIFLVVIFFILILSTTISAYHDQYSPKFVLIISSLVFSMLLSTVLISLPRKLYLLHYPIFIATSIFCFINSFYFRFFRTPILKSQYAEYKNLMQMDLLAYSDLLLPIDYLLPLTILTFPVAYFYLTKDITDKTLFKKTILSVSIVIFCTYAYVLNIRSLDSYNLKKQVSIYNEMTSVGVYFHQYTLLFNSLVACCTNDPEAKIFTPDEISKGKHELKELANLNISETSISVDQERNLIIILVESLNSLGVKPDVMPFLYSLTQDTCNIYIPKIEHNVEFGLSMDGQLITLTGIHPAKDRFLFRICPDVVLPSIYKSSKTNSNSRRALFTITDKYFWRQDYAAKAMGIDDIFGNELLAKNDNEWLTDNELFDNIVADLDTVQKQRKIYTILTGDSHVPFDDERPELSEMKADSRNSELYPYFIALQYTDSQIMRLFETLESNDELKNTTVLITADHSLNVFGNNHIPMLIYNPVNNSCYRPKTIPQQISIYPTLLFAMGIIDSTYMGLTPPMTSPRIEEFGDDDLARAKVLSEMIQYNGLLTY